MPHCLHPQSNPLSFKNLEAFPFHHARISGRGKHSQYLGAHTLDANLVAQAHKHPKVGTRENAPSTNAASGPGSAARLQIPPLQRSLRVQPACAVALRTPQAPEAYLKHMVSSPEDFRHGYLVVAILFSEQTSL
jgi:hypothetical protein